MEGTQRKKIVKIFVICIAFIVLAGIMESTDQELKNGNQIERNKPGESSKDVSLVLNGAGFKDYPYDVSISEEKLTREEAQKYFEEAEQEIEETFYTGEGGLNHVSEKVELGDRYAQDIVEADWMFSENLIMDDGSIDEERLERYEENQEGVMVTAAVSLSCQDYGEEYQFSFIVYPRLLTGEEASLKEIEDKLLSQMEQEGQQMVTLPDEIGKERIVWREAKQHLVLKIVLLELVIGILYCLAKRERQKEALRQRKKSMELEYSEIVSKMAILLGSGMSIKQAWSKISARYLIKRDKNQTGKVPIYEEMLVAEREIEDGNSERAAYQNFAERVNIMCYQRLIRILISSLERGSRQICDSLQQESEEAFQERKAVAKRMGEEASTKMLAPMMIMMSIVIAIIIVPALLSFK